MTVSLADVDRWDVGCLRQVSTALGKRGASADEVKAGLHLATGPTTVPDGRTLEGVSGPHAHSQYPQQGDNHQPRISGYNIAAVIAGLTPIPGN